MIQNLHKKQKRRRILFVIDALHFGGGERVFAQIINKLPAKDYEIFLASHSNLAFYQTIQNKNINLFSLNFSKQINIFLILKLVRIIRKNRIDIVHSQGARADFYTRIASWIAGNCSVVSTVAAPVEEFDVGYLRKKIYGLFNGISENLVDKFIVVSDSLRVLLINKKIGITPAKIVRIYNGIEIDHYYPQADSRNRIRSNFGIEDDVHLLGAIGRLARVKGFEYLIKALPFILEEDPNARVIIVGEGPLRRELEIIANKVHVKNYVLFAGFRGDVQDILSAVDLVAVPSLREGFPMIILEAMAMGKPIIASKISGIEEQIINGKYGLLVPPGDAVVLAKAICYLLKNKGLRDNLGMNARKRVEENYSIEKMVAETAKLYLSFFE